MGAKVLSLDGGGVRGILHCNVLQEIQKQLFGIEIVKLFDLILGTSAGGLVALQLASTEKTLPELAISLDILAKNGYEKPRLGFITHTFGKPKYKRKKLKECYKNILNDKFLSKSFPKIRVAVVAVTQESGDFDECIFSNYQKKTYLSKCFKQTHFISDSKVTDAAAPTYFRTFDYDSRQFLDGGLKNNNPCKVAMKECKDMWPGRNLDLLVSLGTGDFPSPEYQKNNIFKVGDKEINLLTQSINSWREAHEIYDGLKEGRNSFRCNPNFQKSIGLYEMDDNTMNILKKQSVNIKNDQTVYSIIKKSLSSLFYIDDLIFDQSKKQLTGNIKCRLDIIPIGIVNQLKKGSSAFVLNYSNNDNTFRCFSLLHPHLHPNNQLNDFSIPFEINNPPDIIDILCTMVALNNIKNDTSISGNPFSIKNGIKNSLITLKN
ncbi:hypothetical protein ACTFIR_010125 [Dictyostelium discoideum]